MSKEIQDQRRHGWQITCDYTQRKLKYCQFTQRFWSLPEWELLEKKRRQDADGNLQENRRAEDVPGRVDSNHKSGGLR